MTFTEALFALMPMQALAAALVLIVLVGWRGANAGGRWAQVGLVALALGLALLSPVMSGRLSAPHGLHSAGIAIVSAGLSALRRHPAPPACRSAHGHARMPRRSPRPSCRCLRPRPPVQGPQH